MAKEVTPKTKIELEIVQLVKDRRAELNRTQSHISDLLGVTRGYIGQIEMESSPSMYSYDQLNELAKYLECSMRDFVPEHPL
ncbi:helix-turn-helix domain-containing protein [Sinomicrobium weinanense]|uniref:Helix-turn-helix transcriptional regulator n=1 Tax=Sinomicrobium weinanense TaxID=2842200 RepID=A0A926JPS2_9FLAO|nr:helix-turn-helix transcriptional regulator [Sinomicrobium weinanense]MBC9795121.1 helix-turn-helix transcriptional regulator [Sinomicrobium weinanense]MBU3123747.1 helix-turn-helix domain-containing protein [Sinomicrobium weinanense]